MTIVGSTSRFGRRSVATAAVFLLLGGSAVTVGVASAAGQAPPRIEAAVTLQQAEVFVSVAPTRVLDTRGPNFLGPIGVPVAKKIGPNEQLDLMLTGSGKVIPDGATAAVLNVTIDNDATSESFVTIWPKGTPRPNASASNATPGSIMPNLTIAKLSADGGISIYNLKGSINLVLDVVGYMVPMSSVSGIGTGSTVLNGSGAPANSLGNDGDYYIDNSTHDFYGPKTGGTWPLPPTSLIGPAGATGATGAAGATGATGATGAAGGLLAAASAYNSGGLLSVVPLGTAVDFPTPGDGFGSNIVRTNSTTYTLAATGTYQITYNISSADVGLLNGNVNVVKNSTIAIGPGSKLASLFVGASNTVLVNATAGDTVQLVISGLLTIGTLNS
ncbi:MAG: hypothetical protein ABIQ39_15785, partial [Ilumatobacteraceae bacterium]